WPRIFTAPVVGQDGLFLFVILIYIVLSLCVCSYNKESNKKNDDADHVASNTVEETNHRGRALVVVSAAEVMQGAEHKQGLLQKTALPAPVASDKHCNNDVGGTSTIRTAK
ncbi:unnamed protein product, partial [Amoebophrya sp. A25]